MGLKINRAHAPKASAWIERMKVVAAAKAASAPPQPAIGSLARMIRQIRAETKPKKPTLSVVEAKKAMKLLEASGKTVTGIEMHAKGGFVVHATVPDARDSKGPSTAANPWDEVFPNGET